MDVRIKATDYELDSDTRHYLDERINSIVKLLGDDADISRCEVELGRAAGNQRHGDHLYFAEINLVHPHGANIHAVNNESTINAAIDKVKDEVVQQLRKRKSLHRRIVRRGGAILKNFIRFGGGE